VAGENGRVTTLGVVFLPQNPPERLRAVVRAADEAGLAELWLWEDCFLESGIATAAAALAWSQRLRIGVGLLPVPLRNVALTAMELATLHRLFPGRVTVGVGHGVQDWMAQVGAKPASPMTLLREHLTALRALLAGERVTVEGRYVRLDGVALDWPPTAPAPVFAGATGPRSLRLAGELADGVVLTGGTSPDGVRQARELIEAGQATGGRRGTVPVAVYVHAATGPGAPERMEAERVRWGYPSMDDVGVQGDAPAIAAGVRRFAEAGAGTVVLQPTPDDPDPEGFVRFVAHDVAPLV
jgi:alkanesulfonate monooxygenase SsuD/methylene tetrahydromethanopterin reductase-like flavin-dependent oxidoreductase (luciferase family)